MAEGKKKDDQTLTGGAGEAEKKIRKRGRRMAGMADMMRPPGLKKSKPANKRNR